VCEQVPVEAVRVHCNDGLVEVVRLFQSDHLGEFLERAIAAGQGDVGVGQTLHTGLRFCHGRRHQKRVGRAAGDAVVDEALRDHPDYRPPAVRGARASAPIMPRSVPPNTTV